MMTNLEILQKATDKDQCLNELTDCLVQIVCYEIKKMSDEQECYLDISNFDKAEIKMSLTKFFNTENPLSTKETDKNKRITDIVTEIKNSQMADDVYRALWYDHVLLDVQGHMENTKETLSEEDLKIAETVAERYVYNNRYDCNLSYWDNFDNLLNELNWVA